MTMLLGASALGQSIRVPLHVGKGQRAVYIDAVVGGEVRHFLIDTGAHTTHVRPDILGATVKRSSHLGDDNVGFVGGAQKVDNFEMKLGDKTYSFPVMASDMKVVRQYNKDIDGLLGQDFLSTFTRVTFDYKSHELVLEK